MNTGYILFRLLEEFFFTGKLKRLEHYAIAITISVKYFPDVGIDAPVIHTTFSESTNTREAIIPDVADGRVPMSHVLASLKNDRKPTARRLEHCRLQHRLQNQSQQRSSGIEEHWITYQNLDM